MSQPRSASASPRPPSAKLLAGVFRTLNEGVFIAEPNFSRDGLRLLHVNDALCAISGHAAEDLIGSRHGKLHGKGSDLPVVRKWFRGLGKSTAPYSGDGYLRRADGSSCFAAWTFNALTDSDGAVTHIVGTYRDMTANRRLQDALIHSQRLDAVGRLAGGVAHDFNNLLSVINGYCEILHRTVGDHEKALKEVGEIHRAGLRASGLVRQLLAFGRRQALDPRVIAPNQLVRENAEILARLLGDERSLELSLHDRAGNIKVDPTQLQQVLLNLVLNARDATQPGDHVVISTENRHVAPGLNRRVTDLTPGDYVVLTVTDNGCGMDAAVQAVVFEPFFTTKDEGMGTGLGLALVHGVVKQSGGHILVRSQPGVGTTFEIFLPEAREPATPTLGSLLPLPVTRGRETLLVLEDDDVVRKMVAGILGADGYVVIAVPSAASALVELKRLGKAVHLIIADHTEPTGDVRTLIRKLHRSQTGLRVLSTCNRDTRPLRNIAAHRQAILPKPFALSTLLQDVRKLLDAGD